MERAMGKRSGAKLAVVIAAAVLLVLLLAAPAIAAPAATSLVASSSQFTVGAGDGLTIRAVLTDTDNNLPVGDQAVRVEQAASAGGPWGELLNYADNGGPVGEYSLEVFPEVPTYYRFVYAPNPVEDYAPSTSNIISVGITGVGPFATSLVASPSLSTVNIGDSLTISALLTDTVNDAPVGGEMVAVEQATSSGGPWSSPIQLLTTDDTTGVASYDFVPTQTAYYRFVFQGTAIHNASTSNAISVVVIPLAASLTASSSQTTVSHGTGLTVSAVLTETVGGLPIGGATLRVESATSSSGPWSLIQTVTNDGSTGSYSLAVLPPRTTYYRFVYEGTGTYAAATSNVLPVTVTSVPTSLTASPGETTVTAGTAPTISAVLTETDGALPIGGATLRVEQATSSSGPWSLIQTVTNDGSTGSYSLAVKPLRTMHYRFVFEGTSTYAAVTSGDLTIKVKPVLKTPTCPSSVKKSKTFKVKGTVAPGAPDGPAVKIQAYRKHGGKWSKYKSAHSTTRSGINYTAKIKITSTGKYKFKATVAGSDKFVAVTSAYSKVLTVKK